VSRSKLAAPRSLVWLRRVRAALAAEEAKAPASRAVRLRDRKVEHLIGRLGLRRMPAEAVRSRRRRLPE